MGPPFRDTRDIHLTASPDLVSSRCDAPGRDGALTEAPRPAGRGSGLRWRGQFWNDPRQGSDKGFAGIDFAFMFMFS